MKDEKDIYEILSKKYYDETKLYDCQPEDFGRTSVGLQSSSGIKYMNKAEKIMNRTFFIVGYKL